MSSESALHVDDDGFVLLVAPDTYRGFVSESWTLDEILSHFVAQMNRASLFVAHPGPDAADEPLALETAPSARTAKRDASGVIEVGLQGLWLTDYAQLTMAAQYEDEPPITEWGSTRLPAEPGRYRIQLRELSEGDPTYVLTLTPDEAEIGEIGEIQSVPWF